jgi:hypothetical protein
VALVGRFEFFDEFREETRAIDVTSRTEMVDQISAATAEDFADWSGREIRFLRLDLLHAK